MVWHSFGVTHVPRVEDWPVMPKESVSACTFAHIPTKPTAGTMTRTSTLTVGLQVDDASWLMLHCSCQSDLRM